MAKNSKRKKKDNVIELQPDVPKITSEPQEEAAPENREEQQYRMKAEPTVFMALIDSLTKGKIISFSADYDPENRVFLVNYLEGFRTYDAAVLREIVRLCTTASVYAVTGKLREFHMEIKAGEPLRYSMHVQSD